MTHIVLPGEEMVSAGRINRTGGKHSLVTGLPGRRSIIGAVVLLSMTGCASFQGFNKGPDSSELAAIAAIDTDGDGVYDSTDQCQNTLPGTEISNTGCGVLDRTIRSKSFNHGAAQIDVAMRQELDVLSEQLAFFPDVRIAIEAHTDGKGPDDINVSVARSRALAVRRYLLRRGNDDNQMDLRYFGESWPIADNNTEEGRAMNRRVQIVTLPLDVKIETGDVSHLGNLPHHQALAYRTPPKKIAGTTVKPKPEKVTTTHSAQKQLAAATAVETMKASATPPVQTATATVTQQSAVLPRQPYQEPPAMAAAMVPELANSIDVLPAPVSLDGLDLGGIVKGVEFVRDSAELYGESSAQLDTIASKLQNFPQVDAIVMAHSATLGSASDNLELSIERANVFKDALVDRGVDRERVDARGYGDTLPLVQAISTDDQETNTRVEIRVVER